MQTLSVADIARETGTPERTVRHWLKNGRLPGVRVARDVGGVRWAVAPEVLQRLRDDHAREEAP